MEQFFEAAEIERLRLEAAIDAARQRVEVARRRLMSVRGLRDRLGAMVLEAEGQHAQLESDTERVVAELLAVAIAEADVCVSSARAEVARRTLAATVRDSSAPRSSVPSASSVVIDLDQRRVEVG